MYRFTNFQQKLIILDCQSSFKVEHFGVWWAMEKSQYRLKDAVPTTKVDLVYLSIVRKNMVGVLDGS